MDFRIRRLRRGDFETVGQIVTSAGLPPLASDRATLRRLRRVVADLGSDFYLATRSASGVGLVHIAYTRDLLVGNRGHILALITDPAHRDSALEQILIGAACERAKKRQCHDLRWVDGPWATGLEELLRSCGWRSQPPGFRIDLMQSPGQSRSSSSNSLPPGQSPIRS